MNFENPSEGSTQLESVLSEDGGEVIQQSRRQSLAYKEMPYSLYLFATLSLYGGQVFLSIIVNDIGLIFEFISAISISALAFIFPGAFFLVAERKYATSLQKATGKRMRIRAWFFVVLGIFAFLF